MVALLLAGVLLATANPDFVTIRVLATSDLQSRVRPSPDFDAPGVPRRELGGWEALAARLVRHRTPHTLLLDCGNFAFGSPESDSTHGRAAVRFMNALQYAAAAVGARDFTGGAMNLEFLADEADFPVLGSPMLDVVLRRQVPLFRPFTIKEIDDIRIALIGITDPDIPMLNTTDNTLGLPVDPPMTQVRQVLSVLEAANADVVVAFGQMSAEDGAALLDSFSRLDLVVYPARQMYGAPERDRLVPVGAFGQRVAQADMLYHLGRREVDGVQYRQLNVLPVQDTDTVPREVAELVESVVLLSADSVVTSAPAEFPRDEWGLVLLGSTVAGTVRDRAGAEVAVLPVEVFEPGLPEGMLSKRDLYRVVPFEERLRMCTLDDTSLNSLFRGAEPDGLAPLLSGASYYVLGDTSRWPIVSQVARVRTAGLQPPYRVVTTENLLEKAGMAGKGLLLPRSLTDLWVGWASSKENVDHVLPVGLFLAAPGLVLRPEGHVGPININTATAGLLEQLPGIGPKTAQRIVEYREAHGRFGSVDELQYVKGIGPKKLETIRPLATVR